MELTRTTRETVHFHRPFTLRGLDGVQPAGDYEVDADEDLIEGIETVAYLRKGTFINLPSLGALDRRLEQHVPVEKDDLDAALARDRQDHAAAGEA